METKRNWLVRIIKWIVGYGLAGLLMAIPAITIGIIIIILITVLYLSPIFTIPSIWLKFASEWKWNKWGVRARHEIGLAHNNVLNLLRELVN